MEDSVTDIAHTLLAITTKCPHCDGQAAIEYVEDGTVGVHVCPGRYVSRIIVYGSRVNPGWFREFVQRAVQRMQKIEERDVRVASRYAWDLGLERESNAPILKEMYWTQNYRRAKSEDPNRTALFLCANRDSFFIQPLQSVERLCDKCRAP